MQPHRWMRAIVWTFALLLGQAAVAYTIAHADTPVHVVQRGETLTSIAQEHGLTIDAIASTNGLTDVNTLYVGQKLTIPVAQQPRQAVPRTQRELPPKETEDERSLRSYIVRPGDTLTDIAQRMGVPPVALARANGLRSSSLLFAGRRLTVPRIEVAETNSRQIWVKVSISQQRCWVFDGGSVLYDWKCSTGRRSSPTKPGTYYVQSKIRTAYGSAWDIWMPYWLGIYWAGSTENGFHGMPWNASNGRETWPGLVGTPITYGCIMLTNDNARTLWELAYIGMPVVIEY